MGKQTKNIITREKIENDLLFSNTATLKYTAVCFAALMLAFLGIGLFILALSYAAAIVTFTIAGIIICVFAVMFARIFIERRHLKNGDVEIVIRHLLYKDERLVRVGKSSRMQEMFHFAGFEEVWANHTEYQLATMDDEFYIVHYKGSKTVKMLFPLKMYELKEQ